jgi:hypothetical protein
MRHRGKVHRRSDASTQQLCATTLPRRRAEAPPEHLAAPHCWRMRLGGRHENRAPKPRLEQRPLRIAVADFHVLRAKVVLGSQKDISGRASNAMPTCIRQGIPASAIAAKKGRQRVGTARASPRMKPADSHDFLALTAAPTIKRHLQPDVGCSHQDQKAPTAPNHPRIIIHAAKAPCDRTLWHPPMAEPQPR